MIVIFFDNTGLVAFLVNFYSVHCYYWHKNGIILAIIASVGIGRLRVLHTCPAEMACLCMQCNAITIGAGIVGLTFLQLPGWQIQ